MVDNATILEQVSLAHYLDILERLAIRCVREIRQESDAPDIALASYIDTSVDHAPEPWRAEVRALLERVIAQSVS